MTGAKRPQENRLRALFCIQPAAEGRIRLAQSGRTGYNRKNARAGTGGAGGKRMQRGMVQSV